MVVRPVGHDGGQKVMESFVGRSDSGGGRKITESFIDDGAIVVMVNRRWDVVELLWTVFFGSFYVFAPLFSLFGQI